MWIICLIGFIHSIWPIGTDSGDLEIWDDGDDLLEDITTISTPSPPIFCHSTQQKNVHAIKMWVIGFLLSLQSKFYIPDSSINLLIHFFFVFISVTGRFSAFMKQLADVFPRSLSTVLNLVKDEQFFTKFVVCRKCHALYDYADCQEKIGSRTESKGCTNTPFPNHPHHSKRVPCNCPLLKILH